MADAIQEFCRMVEMVHEWRAYAVGLRGPRSLCVQSMNMLLGRNSPSVQEFQNALTVLDRRFAVTEDRPPDHGDTTIATRWAAHSALMRACLVDSASESFGRHLQDAKKSFEEVWEVVNRPDHGDRPTLTLFDPASAARADKELFSRVEKHLSPWTPGSWLAWDVLCQVNQKAGPVAAGKTAVLFGRGQGQVMQLVVEALPGPAGLVTPNWWLLGLTAFPTTDSGRYLVNSIQRMLQLAPPVGAAALRLRWHLEADELEAWRFGLEGRSLEAAAASVALAVLELYDEIKQRENGSITCDPILDPRIAVSAVVGAGGQLPFPEWPLQPVAKDTLQAKFAAAARARIDWIGLAPKQALDGVVVPPGVRVEEVATVADALNLLRTVNRALNRYGDFVRSQFKYQEEETPLNP